MGDFLNVLVRDALETVRNGYYDIEACNAPPKISLKESIIKCRHAPVIAEIKPVSPSRGRLRRITNPAEVAKAMEAGGSAGISVLTEPRHFHGSLDGLVKVKRSVDVPVLMKDIIVDPVQIEAAAKLGADAVLLIYRVFEKGIKNHTLGDFIRLAHSKGLEVLLETHTREECSAALETEADLVGINNRDLATLKVDFATTKSILSSIGRCGRIVVCESGIQTAEDVRVLYSYGARGFLVGSAIMLAEDVEAKVRELVMAL